MSFKIADGYVEVNARVDENQARAAANRVTNAVGDESERVGNRRGRDFFRAMFTPDRNIVTMLRTGIPAVLGSPVGAAALTLGALFASSFIGAFISSGVMAAIGGGFLGLGAIILQNNEKLAASFQSLGKTAQASLEDAAAPLVPVFDAALRRVQAMFDTHIAAPLHQIFQGLAPAVIPLAESIVQTVSNILNALAAPEVLGGLRDFMLRFAQELPRVGSSIGELFAKLARESNLMGEGFSFVVSIIENLMNFVGDALVTLTQMGVGFARIWGEVDSVIIPIIGTIGAVIGVLTSLHPAVLTTAGTFTALAIGMRRAGTAAGALRFAFGPMGLIIGAAATALATFSAGSTDTSHGVQEMTRRLQESNGVIDDGIRKWTATQLAQGGVLEMFDSVGISAANVTDAFLGNADASAQVRARLQEMKDSGEISGETFNILNSVLDQGNQITGQAQEKQRLLGEATRGSGDAAEQAGGQFEAAAGRTERWADAQERAAEKAEQAEEAYDEARQALEDYKDEIAGAVSPVTDYLDSLESSREAQSDYNEAVKEFGPNSRQARDALFDLIDAENKTEAAAITLREEIDSVRESLREDFEGGRISEADFEAAMGQLDKIDEKIDKTAEPRETKLRTEVDEAKRKADEAKLDAAAHARNVNYLSHREPQTGTETESRLDSTARDREASFRSSVVRRLLGQTDNMLDGVAKQRTAPIAPFAPYGRRQAVNSELNMVARHRQSQINAVKGMDFVSGWLNGIARDRTSTIRVVRQDVSFGMAAGGILGAQGASSQAQAGGPRGRDVLVGEHGPEIAQLPLGTRVIPAGQTQAAMSSGAGSGGSMKIEIINRGVIGSSAQLQNWLVQALEELRRQRRLPMGG